MIRIGYVLESFVKKLCLRVVAGVYNRLNEGWNGRNLDCATEWPAFMDRMICEWGTGKRKVWILGHDVVELMCEGNGSEEMDAQ